MPHDGVDGKNQCEGVVEAVVPEVYQTELLTSAATNSDLAISNSTEIAADLCSESSYLASSFILIAGVERLLLDVSIRGTWRLVRGSRVGKLVHDEASTRCTIEYCIVFYLNFDNNIRRVQRDMLGW